MVAPPVLRTPLPATMSLEPGDPLALDVGVDGPEGSALEYVWSRTPHDLDDPVTGAHLDIAELTADDAGTYTVTVTAVTDHGPSAAVRSSCTVTVLTKGTDGSDTAPPPDNSTKPLPKPLPDVPLVWDAPFARLASLAGAGSAVVLLVLLGVVAAATSSDVRLALVTVLALTVVLVCGGLLLAVLDLRGRARVGIHLEPDPGTGHRGDPVDVVKAAPAVITSFGSLTLASAVLLLAAIGLVCATSLAWHTVPAPAGGSATATSTMTAPASTTASTGPAVSTSTTSVP